MHRCTALAMLGIMGFLSLPAALADSNSPGSDVIRLRTGVAIKGYVTRETRRTISYSQFGQTFTLKKSKIAVKPVPSPMVAMAAGLLFPGGAQLYLGDLSGFKQTLGVSMVAGLAGYGGAQILGQSKMR